MIFLQRGQLNASAAAPPKTDEPESASVMASLFSQDSAAIGPASRDQYTPSRLWMTPGVISSPQKGHLLFMGAPPVKNPDYN